LRFFEDSSFAESPQLIDAAFKVIKSNVMLPVYDLSDRRAEMFILWAENFVGDTPH